MPGSVQRGPPEDWDSSASVTSTWGTSWGSHGGRIVPALGRLEWCYHVIGNLEKWAYTSTRIPSIRNLPFGHWFCYLCFLFLFSIFRIQWNLKTPACFWPCSENQRKDLISAWAEVKKEKLSPLSWGRWGGGWSPRGCDVPGRTLSYWGGLGRWREAGLPIPLVSLSPHPERFSCCSLPALGNPWEPLPCPLSISLVTWASLRGFLSVTCQSPS